jgi:PAS domain S-box-containing protein
VNVWERLTAPLVDVRDEDLRRQVIVLASLSLVVLVLSESAVIAMAIIIPSVPINGLLVLVTAIGLYIIPYLLFRRARITTGLAFATGLAISLVVFGVLTLGGYEGMYLLSLLNTIALFAATFRSIRAALALTLLNCALMLIIGLNALGVEAVVFVAGMIMVNLTATAFSMTIVQHWRQDLMRQQVALMESERRYRIISQLNSEYTFYYQLRPDGTYTREWVTEAFERMTGYRLDELPRSFMDELYHPDDRERIHADRQAAFRGEMVEGTYRIIHKNGGERWVHIKRIPAWDAAHQVVTGQFGVVDDVTERKLAEEQRLQFALHQQQFTVVNDLVGAISHDFRTRLATVESSRYLVSKLLALGGPQDKIESRLETIHKAVSEMSQQLANLATVASLNSIQMSRVDINSMLATVHARFLARAEAAHIALTLEMDESLPLIEADEPKLDIALDHLVSNALDNSTDSGRIWLRSGRVNGCVFLEVGDTGVGIPEHKREQIFAPFQKVDDARTVAHSGLGLGLTIVKMIGDLHGARIDVESEVGRGSVFRMLLPLERSGVQA